MWQLPLAAAVVGYAFAAVVWAQYVYRQRPHQLAWALGLSAYALASAVEAWVSVNGWSGPLYRGYFVLAAGNVGLLGAGTMLLLRNGRWGRAFALFTAVGVLVSLFAPWELHLAADTLVTLDDGSRVPLGEAGLAVGSDAIPFTNPGRVAFLLLNVVGGLALVGGALWSWRQTRAPGVLLIGAGALVPFLTGSASTLAGLDARVLGQLVGIVVMFAGFLMGSRAAPASADGAAVPGETATAPNG